jgi:hypothetical protein
VNCKDICKLRPIKFHEGGKLYILVLANYLEEKEKEKKTLWGGDIVSRGTREPQAPTKFNADRRFFMVFLPFY